MDITLSSEEELFIVNSGNSCSTLGFDVVFAQACEFAKRLIAAGHSATIPEQKEVGTVAQYEQYAALLEAYRQLGDTATWFDARTPVKVQKILERVRRSGETVRVFYGDTLTGRDWLTDYDTVGRIGRSFGPMMVPLLLAPGALGGSALLSSNIVRVVSVDSGQELYRHPAYHQPHMDLVEAASYDRPRGLTHSVYARDKDGELEMDPRASFTSLSEAAYWLAFITGKTHEYVSQ